MARIVIEFPEEASAIEKIISLSKGLVEISDELDIIYEGLDDGSDTVAIIDSALDELEDVMDLLDEAVTTTGQRFTNDHSPIIMV